MGLSLKKVFKKVDKVLTGGTIGNMADKAEHEVKKVWNDFTGNTAIDKQNEYNMKMWELQNQYNTPANQMHRYLEAGLNPNLIYSQGSAGNATSAPEMRAHNSSFSKIMDLLSNFVNLNGSLRNQQLHELSTLSGIQHSADVLEFQKHQFAVQQALRQQEGERWLKEFDERVRHNKAMENAPKGGLYGLLERGLSSFFGKPVTDVLSDSGNFVKNVAPENVGRQDFQVGNMVKPLLKVLYRELGTYGRNIRLRDKSWSGR